MIRCNYDVMFYHIFMINKIYYLCYKTCYKFVSNLPLKQNTNTEDLTNSDIHCDLGSCTASIS